MERTIKTIEDGTIISANLKTIQKKFPYHTRNEIKEYSKWLRNLYDMQLSAIRSVWYRHQENVFDGEEAEYKLLDAARNVIDKMEQTDCKYLIIEDWPNRRVYRGGKWKPAFKLMCEIGEYAYSRGKMIGIIPISVQKGRYYIQNEKEAEELIQKSGSKGLQIITPQMKIERVESLLT